MDSGSSDSASIHLSLVAQFDDINRLNGVLNDGTAERRFLAFLKQVEWCRAKWLSVEEENLRLQTELDDAHRQIAKMESQFSRVRQLLDNEKQRRKNVVLENEDLVQQMALARDLLFSDNYNKLNDETRQKIGFILGKAKGAKLNKKLSLNNTGTVLTDMSYSRSEEDVLEASVLSGRGSWVGRGQWNARPDQPAPKKRRSSVSSATKMVDVQSGKVLATATTTLTLERAPTAHDLKPPTSFQPISESSDEAATPRRPPPPPDTPRRTPAPAPSAPLASETDSSEPAGGAAGGGAGAGVTRSTSVRAAEQWGASPRARPRPHRLVNKHFYKRELCSPCQKPIPFAHTGVKCETCRGVAHSACRSLLPLPCVSPGSNTKPNNMGCIADFAPSSSPMVPALLVHCINEVEKRGLNEKGLYRVSAADSQVKKLKERFLRGCGAPPLGAVDVHVLCGCIKDFLRSLREPLVTNALWQNFVEAGKAWEGRDGDATPAVVQCVSQLPPPNRDTLAFLVLHLHRVAESEECQMGLDNLAKVFGPTVIGYGLTDTLDLYAVTPLVVQTMRAILSVGSEYWARWAYVDAYVDGNTAPATRAHVSPARNYFYAPADHNSTRKKGYYYNNS